MTNFWNDLIFGPNRMGKNYKDSSNEYPNTDPYNLSPNLQKDCKQDKRL